MADNVDKTVSTIMTNLENFVSAKTIVGEPMQYKDIIVFPMADVSFGVAAGSFNKEKNGNNNGATGAGAKLTPSAVLIIQNGTSKVVNIKDKDSINKLIDLIPDLINKLTDKLNETPKEKQRSKKSNRIKLENDYPNIDEIL